MGIFSGETRRGRIREPMRMPEPEPEPEPELEEEMEDAGFDDGGDDEKLAEARRLFNEGRRLLSDYGEAERGFTLIMQAVGAGLPEAALFFADMYLDAFEKQYPQVFRPRWCHDLENAKAFCNFYVLAERFGAEEDELHRRMLAFLSHFGGESDIDYFNSEVYLPLKMQLLARLEREGM